MNRCRMPPPLLYYPLSNKDHYGHKIFFLLHTNSQIVFFLSHRITIMKFVVVIEKNAKKLKGVGMLLQGTIFTVSLSH